MRRFATGIATSETLIAETSACSARSIARRALVVSRFGSLARQIQVAVSSTITKWPPSPRARGRGA
jgi:hypothetical protein